MHDALYGADGFYRSPGAPGRHFRTAAHASPLWAAAMVELAARVDAALGEPKDFSVVDVGSGGGELIAGIAAVAPDRWTLIGVDIADRPAQLPEHVGWSDKPPKAVSGLLIAVEWLDVVPVDVVELTDDGPRYVEVADDGEERISAPVDDEDREWLRCWWPLADIGDRAEIGRSRDTAWSAALRRTLGRGVAVAVDYATHPMRDVAGTITAYRDGRQLLPVPDGSCDITAHVLMESCAAAVTDVDATQLLTQRDALQQLGITGERPSYDGDPGSYVAALSRASEAAELLDPHGLGGFAWLLHARACALTLRTEATPTSP